MGISAEENADGEGLPVEAAAVNPLDVRVAAMNLLARREHSRLELERKLSKRFGDHDVVNEQLDRLAAERLQSDRRYAESFLRQRIDRGHGLLRIRQEMRQKGLPVALIDAALEAESPDWHGLAAETFRRKFGDLPADDIRDKARRSRFMQYRGFELEHYRHLLD
jgi:regulatory protein